MNEKAHTSATPALDLAIHHDIHRAGDITAYMTWTLHNGQPCIVLVPTFARVLTHERITPCIVPMSRAWVWDERTGDGAQSAHTSMVFASNLGFNITDTSKILKITTIIRDLLGDLLAMPPMPAALLRVTAEAIITDNATGKVIEKEIQDYA